jgi:hypothetical protein
MLSLPKRTLYNKKIPKNKFYKEIGTDSKLESKFIQEVDYIVWKHKLSKETTNLEPTKEVEEIQVFEVFLKTEDLSKEVLENIDRVIPYPILYILRFNDKIKLVIAYKEKNKLDENRMVIHSYYETEWIKEDEMNIDILSGLTLKDVYDNIIRQLLPIENAEDDIEDLIELNQRIEALKKDIEKLEKKMYREKQFNKKVDINRELRSKIKELNSLTTK